MSNGKTPDKNDVKGYWLKKLILLHPCIGAHHNHIFDGERPLPDLMTFGKLVLCQKDPPKGSAIDNFRPISRLPLMWKLLTEILAEKICSYLESRMSDDLSKKCQKRVGKSRTT